MSRLKEKLARLHGKTNIEIDRIEQQKESSKTEVNIAETTGYINGEVVDETTGDINSEASDDIIYSFDDPVSKLLSENNIGLYTNEFGSFLLKRTSYSLTFQHGVYTLGQLQSIAPFLNRFFAETHNGTINTTELLFFDLETTGLGTGTGNIPFMVGLGYFKENVYIVEQAVIRHAAEERAMLAYLHRLTSSFTYLITYNGKTFDWPLTVNRYVLNGMREEIWQPQHIDLLHPSRSIWRNTLQSCKLSHIEEARLGITRIDDLPGSEAPDRYFKYLADGDPTHILPVYEHNRLDMLTLVSLLTRFGYLLSDSDVKSVIQLPNEPEEMIRTGLWLEKMGLMTYCEELFTVAIAMPVIYAPTLYKLSLRDKQSGNIDRAIYLWEKIINSDTVSFQAKLDCCIQLAIYYEHKRKQFALAIHYTSMAIQFIKDLINEASESKKREAIIKNQLKELEKRLERLSKKANK